MVMNTGPELQGVPLHNYGCHLGTLMHNTGSLLLLALCSPKGGNWSIKAVARETGREEERERAVYLGWATGRAYAEVFEDQFPKALAAVSPGWSAEMFHRSRTPLLVMAQLSILLLSIPTQGVVSRNGPTFLTHRLGKCPCCSQV
jgi:hypothetical protein